MIPTRMTVVFCGIFIVFTSFDNSHENCATRLFYQKDFNMKGPTLYNLLERKQGILVFCGWGNNVTIVIRIDILARAAPPVVSIMHEQKNAKCFKHL